MNRGGPLRRTTPLQPGASLQRRTPLQPGSPLRRTAPFAPTVVGRAAAPHPIRRPRDTGASAAVEALVIARDGGRCVRCGVALGSMRGQDWSMQHRCARGAGGTSRPELNQPGNLILLCGSGVTGCHGWVEHHLTAARSPALGWSISQHCPLPPSQVAVLWFGELVYLADDGTVRHLLADRTPPAPRGRW